MRSFADRDTHFRIELSGTPPSVDGLSIQEPKYMVCDECDARVRIDEADKHQTAIDNLPHTTGCDQRDVISVYYMEKYIKADLLSDEQPGLLKS